MHVKRLAVLGILLAINTILIVLSGVIESNTLALLGIAAFFVGVAIREYGTFQGSTFFIASIILGFMLAPSKMYCLTYAAMGIYILLSEIGWDFVYNIQGENIRKWLFRMIKFLSFNVIYIPVLMFAPKFIGFPEFAKDNMVLMLIAGQIVLVAFEEAYCLFQVRIWDRIKGHLE